jgi:hypothetical protein
LSEGKKEAASCGAPLTTADLEAAMDKRTDYALKRATASLLATKQLVEHTEVEHSSCRKDMKHEDVSCLPAGQKRPS